MDREEESRVRSRRIEANERRARHREERERNKGHINDTATRVRGGRVGG